MQLVKTNIRGFLKDKNSNVLVNDDTKKFDEIRLVRANYKKQKGLEIVVENLQRQIELLNQRINRLEND